MKPITKKSIQEKFKSLLNEKKIDLNPTTKFIFVGDKRLYPNSKVFELDLETLTVRQIVTVPTIVLYKTTYYFWKIKYYVKYSKERENRWQWKNDKAYTISSTVKKAHTKFIAFLDQTTSKMV